MPNPAILAAVAFVCCICLVVGIYFATKGGDSPAPAPATGSSGIPATGTTTPPTPLSAYTGPVSGFDYWGNDLGNYPTSDPNKCAEYCTANSNCKLFATANDSQNCWIKSVAADKRSSGTRLVYPKVGYTLP